MKLNAKKTITVILLLSFCFAFFFIFTEVSARELEVDYPGVGVADTPTETDFGIDSYIVYVFELIFVVIGVAFFGILLYNGIKYMFSSGDPGKHGEAVKGIKAAFLGVTIFLLSWSILNTIDEDFLTIELENPSEIGPSKLPPGAYVCNFELDSVAGISDDSYILYDQIAEEQEDNSDAFCMKLNKRVNEKLLFNKNTYFVIEEADAKRNYGAIFFAKEDGLKHATKKPGVRCEIYIGNEGGPYLDFDDLSGSVINRALSVYPIVINNDFDDTQEITFYEGYSFNEYVPANYSFFDLEDHEGMTKDQIINEFHSMTRVLANKRETINHGDFGEFLCKEIGFPTKEYTCGIRSIEMSEDVFVVFKEGDNCLIVESSKRFLDELLPTKKYTWIGETERGFPTAVYFDSIDIIRGKIN